MNIQERNITSIPDAILTARQLSRNGHEARIDSCGKPTEQDKACPFRDSTLKTLCKQGDGLLPEDGLVFCPLQKGKLQIVQVTAEK